MLEHTLVLQLSTTGLAENTTSRLRQEYQALQRLFQAQPALQQEYLRNQAASLAGAVMKGQVPVRFSLPDSVACLPMMDCSGVVEKILPRARQQRVGGFMDRLTHKDLVMVLRNRLAELEKSSNQATSVAAALTGYAVAVHLIYYLLPAGKSVIYATPEEDEIPNLPVIRGAVSAANPAWLDCCQDGDEEVPNKGEASSLKAGYENRFYLPQHVAFDDQNRLLAADLDEATTHVQALCGYLRTLNSAVILAPYMVVDEEFQSRRYGVLGQLVNQGRALANYQVEVLCATIKRRMENHTLDRGLSLSLPYFNDQTLMVENYNFDIIPGGRVMFVPAFVVLAVRAEAKKILQNTQLSLSTRKSMLQELCIIERAFLR